MFRAECLLTDGQRRRMMKLPMASLRPGDAPTLLLKALDDVTDFHTPRIVRNRSTTTAKNRALWGQAYSSDSGSMEMLVSPFSRFSQYFLTQAS